MNFTNHINIIAVDYFVRCRMLYNYIGKLYFWQSSILVKNNKPQMDEILII